MLRLLNELSEEGQKWVGTKETDEVKVDLLRKVVDGVAVNEPWCMCFVQFCVRQIEIHCGYQSKIFKSEHCLTTWNKSPAMIRCSKPAVGLIAIWQHGNTASGHTGIVIDVVGENDFTTVEANTTEAPVGIVRDGDGIYIKHRSMVQKSNMRLLGFLNPFM